MRIKNVRPSIRPSVIPSIRSSVIPSIRSSVIPFIRPSGWPGLPTGWQLGSICIGEASVFIKVYLNAMQTTDSGEQSDEIGCSPRYSVLPGTRLQLVRKRDRPVRPAAGSSVLPTVGQSSRVCCPIVLLPVRRVELSRSSGGELDGRSKRFDRRNTTPIRILRKRFG